MISLSVVLSVLQLTFRSLGRLVVQAAELGLHSPYFIMDIRFDGKRALVTGAGRGTVTVSTVSSKYMNHWVAVIIIKVNPENKYACVDALIHILHSLNDRRHL